MSSANLSKTITDWANLKAGYRFVNNKKVTHESLIRIEQEKTWQRIEQAGEGVLLAVSEGGVPIGVLDQQVWSRPQNTNRDKEAHKSRPIMEKESFKWLQGLPGLSRRTQQVITVCDREADIY